MKRLFFVMLLAVVLLFAITGCEPAAEPDDPVDVDDEKDLASDVPPELMEQVRQEGSVLYIYDWAGWWPEELFDNFSEEFGVEIVRDHFAGTAEMVTKFRLNPDTEYDLVSSGTHSFFRLKALDVLQALNHDWLPNVTEYLEEDFYDTWYNPNSSHGIITEVSFQGIYYNSDYVDEDDPRLDSWAMIFDADDYAGRITLIDGMYEAIGAALVYLGYDWFSSDEDELMEARDLLLETRDNILAFDSWPVRLIMEEEAYIGQLSPGDVRLLAQDNPAIRAVLPKEGADVSHSTWVIPKGSPNPATAHLFLNYVFRPDVNLLLIEYIGYIPTHKAVYENLSSELKGWPGFMPSDEIGEYGAWATEEAVIGIGHELRAQVWLEIMN